MGQQQREIMDRWIATQNIARYQDKLKLESDICERKLLEGLIAIEKMKLRNGAMIKIFATLCISS